MYNLPLSVAQRVSLQRRASQSITVDVRERREAVRRRLTV